MWKCLIALIEFDRMLYFRRWTPTSHNDVKYLQLQKAKVDKLGKWGRAQKLIR